LFPTGVALKPKGDASLIGLRLRNLKYPFHDLDLRQIYHVTVQFKKHGRRQKYAVRCGFVCPTAPTDSSFGPGDRDRF